MGLPNVQQKLIGIEFNDVDTVAKHALGLKVSCDDGTERRYVRAGAAIAANDALTQDFAEGIYDWQPTSAVDTPVLGVAPFLVADNSFFWAIVSGTAFVKVAAAIVVGAVLTPSAVAGTLDDIALTAANAGGAAGGVGVLAVLDDTPSAGIAKVLLT